MPKPPPADDDPMVECPRCGQVLTYGEARHANLFPTMSDGDNPGPGALAAMAIVECRCGRTAVDVQQRGSLLLVIPRPGVALGGSSGPDASVIL
ncbi:MAG: hypothetical protein ACYDCQ_08085 [Dehalococcoidia bacterium]